VIPAIRRVGVGAGHVTGGDVLVAGGTGNRSLTWKMQTQNAIHPTRPGQENDHREGENDEEKRFSQRGAEANNAQR